MPLCLSQSDIQGCDSHKVMLYLTQAMAAGETKSESTVEYQSSLNNTISEIIAVFFSSC